MNNLIPFDELEKHFKVPKDFGVTVHFKYKRLPRKVKKEYKKNLKPRYLNDINVASWLYMQIVNPNYHRFIIKQISKNNI